MVNHNAGSAEEKICTGVFVDDGVPKFTVSRKSGKETLPIVSTSIFHQISKYILDRLWIDRIESDILSAGPSDQQVEKLKCLRKTLAELVTLADQQISLYGPKMGMHRDEL